jgi:hypothetical protein
MWREGWSRHKQYGEQHTMTQCSACRSVVTLHQRSSVTIVPGSAWPRCCAARSPSTFNHERRGRLGDGRAPRWFDQSLRSVLILVDGDDDVRARQRPRDRAGVFRRDERASLRPSCGASPLSRCRSLRRRGRLGVGPGAGVRHEVLFQPGPDVDLR